MDFVQHVKSSVDIVQAIGEYVRLKRVGAGPRYTGLCPFHTEKTPSFSVHSTRQFYKCFGCGVSGDVFQFIQEIEGLSFWEALKLVAERNGIPVPKRAEYSDAETRFRAALSEMHEIAAQLFADELQGPSGGGARAYLEKRGLSADEIVRFGLGYSDSSGQTLLRRFGGRFPPDQLEASGLVRKRADGSGFFDAFRGRLMFPIRNESGKVIAFAGRALRDEDQPKYLNSPETPLYRKASILYNLDRARTAIRKAGRAVLVEGYMDVIGVCAAGVEEVVASCGTALTNAHVRSIRRHAETIVVNFDPDAAGANAAERSIQMLLEEGMHVRVLELEEELDPDEYVKKFGAEQYRARLDKAGGYFHWLADRARKKFDVRDAEGRMAAFKFLLPAIQRISDKLERAATANDVASYLGVEAGLVLDQFRKAAAERRNAEALRAPRADVPVLERMLVNALLGSAEARVEVLPRLREMGAAEGFATSAIFEALFHLADSGEDVSFSGLEARLDEKDRGLLHDIVFADEGNDEALALEQARGCLLRLESAQQEKKRSDLRARVKIAEREGRLEEAFQLYSELQEMEERSRARKDMEGHG